MNYDTQILHNGADRDPVTGALSIPVYTASTFAINTAAEGSKYEYSRSCNPTREALEKTVAALENGKQSFAYASGIAAITNVLLTFLKNGDHAIFPLDIYGGTYRFITTVLTNFGVTYSFVDMSVPGAAAEAVKEETRLIYIETPSNPLLKITSIEKIVQSARQHGIMTVIDNTFMSPYFLRPLDLGVDIVIHSATKFLGGHSDLIAGVATAKDAALCERLTFSQNTYGAILAPADSWLLMRGIKTLSVRMRQQAKNAQWIAEELQKLEWIDTVFYPGLPSHPGHEICKAECSGFGAVIAFKTADENLISKLLTHVEILSSAVSLGGVESILSYPYTMSHGSVPDQEKAARGITKNLLRLSVGLESPEDLLTDLENALR